MDQDKDSRKMLGMGLGIGASMAIIGIMVYFLYKKPALIASPTTREASSQPILMATPKPKSTCPYIGATQGSAQLDLGYTLAGNPKDDVKFTIKSDLGVMTLPLSTFMDNIKAQDCAIHDDYHTRTPTNRLQIGDARFDFDRLCATASEDIHLQVIAENATKKSTATLIGFPSTRPKKNTERNPLPSPATMCRT